MLDEVLGRHASGRTSRLLTGFALVVVAASVAALAVLTAIG